MNTSSEPSETFQEEMDGHLQLLMLKSWFSGLYTWSQTSLIVNINPLFLQSW